MGFRTKSFAIALLLVVGCSGDQSLRRNHAQVHRSIIQDINSAVDLTVRETQQAAEMLTAAYRNRKDCKKLDRSKSPSSIYLPRSARKGARLDCLLDASDPLERVWERLYRETSFLSWLYMYDSDARFLRIYPATNTRTLFGEDLAFDSFLFYKLAAQNFPRPAWVPVGLDMNGTGRIIMFSQAIKLPGSKGFTTLSADIRPSQLLRNAQAPIMSFVNENRLPHVFVYGYQLTQGTRRMVHDFSTNPSKWRVLKAFSGATMQITAQEQAKMDTLEKSVGSGATDLAETELTLSGAKHYCSMMKVSGLDLFSVMCREL